MESAAFYPRPDVQLAGSFEGRNRVLRGSPQHRDFALKRGNFYRGLQGVDRKVRDHHYSDGCEIDAAPCERMMGPIGGRR